jgi:hypothetical protein
MLLTNLALAGQEGRPLSYSRNKSHKYADISFDRVLSGVERIVRADLATEHRAKPGSRGWQSTLYCTQALSDMFKTHGVRPVYAPAPPIILRSRKDRSLMTLPPMKQKLRQIQRVNEMLDSLSVGLSETGVLRLENGLLLFERLEYDAWDRPQLVQQRLRLDRMAVRRVFTSDTKHHGRFHCPAQSLPGAARLAMTLNAEPVVELDFVSMHVALAYAALGVRMPDNPYEVPGFTRDQGKRGLLTAFNATSPDAAVSALADARLGKPVVRTHEEAHRLLAALQARHPAIADANMLCSDAGMRLMFQDSQIMLTAVDRLIAKGIPCIPVHDSLVVSARFEGEAREALTFGWYNQNPELTHCDIEKKLQKPLQYGRGRVVSAPPPLLPEACLEVVEWSSS